MTIADCHLKRFLKAVNANITDETTTEVAFPEHAVASSCCAHVGDLEETRAKIPSALYKLSRETCKKGRLHGHRRGCPSPICNHI
ncbi:hypothetical protein EXN66_Car014421 [Channa argus]|uniref:Uncharacterized protein n=1 Tax=Channa argus TaxID=215402 RepID=A0A6G1Q8J2_CHAAH|nr:hypothetical protein EXN66_Car014421 [Channa argus]